MGAMYTLGPEHQIGEGQGEEGGDLLPRPVGAGGDVQVFEGGVHGGQISGGKGPRKRHFGDRPEARQAALTGRFSPL